MAAPSSIDVAVVGCGVSGLGAAWLLSRDPRVRVHLIEARAALGGHANTVSVRGRPIDTGFLVFNENTYPNLLGLFAELGVPTEPSNMSFAVSLAERAFEWGSEGLGALFATRANLVSAEFRAMLRDLLRFNAEAPAFLARVRGGDKHAAAMSMAQFLEEGDYGTPFRDWYLVPQMAAVWSAAADEVLAFPATTFLQFSVNHSLTQALDRPIWRTVSRRSREYVRRIAASLPADRTVIKLETSVVRVTRAQGAGQGQGTRVTIIGEQGSLGVFDHVVFGA